MLGTESSTALCVGASDADLKGVLMEGELWSIITIVAPLALLAVLVWAFLRNRAAGRRNFEEAERGARKVREDIRRDPQYREE